MVQREGTATNRFLDSLDWNHNRFVRLLRFARFHIGSSPPGVLSLSCVRDLLFDIIEVRVRVRDTEAP